MIIDMHTHYFPDSIAEQTVRKLSDVAEIKPSGNGTLDALMEIMNEDGVDYSVNLPIATRADQVHGINQKAIKQSSLNSKVVSFGTMHPLFREIGNVKEELAVLAHNGVKGIKMHPEYQEFYPDDCCLTDIYEACLEFDLILYFHAGRDVAYKDVHGTPKRFSQVSYISSDLKIVLAHMGGWKMWDEVESHLLGLHDVYFDTAYCQDMEDWQMKEIIFGHGAYKILFGTDMPWERPQVTMNKIKNLDLGSQIENMIFGNNAKLLLNI